MANKLVGLVGPGVGPQICVKRFSKMKARISGLTHGFVEAVLGEERVRIETNGDHELPPSEWVCFIHKDGLSKNLLCVILGS